MMSAVKRLALHLVALVALALALHAPDFTVTDTDGYYHLRHAWVYRTAGLLHSDFPWTQQSVIHKFGGDLWYGFHLLLVPLTWLTDLVQAIHVGAFAVTCGALVLFYLALKRLDATMPLGWAVALAVASADLAFRLTMLRPHALSLGLVLLLYALLAAPPKPNDAPPSREWLPLLALSALLAWLHLALVWIPILVLVVVAALTLLLERRLVPLPRMLGLLGGLLVGWFVRPAPLGAARLAWIQVVEFQRAKGLGAIQVGHELQPLDAATFVAQLLPLALVAAIGVVIAFASSPAPAQRARLWSAFLLAAGFLTLAFASARRATEFFVGFALLFVAQVATALVQPAQPTPRRKHAPAAASSTTRTAVTVLLVVGIAFGALRSWPVMREYKRLVTYHFAPERMRDTGAWLAEHATGQVVLNVRWDRFGQLFFWNPKSYYINGMDPIFEYAFDPRIHGINFLLAADAVDAFATEEGRRRMHIDKDLRRLVLEDFGSKFLVTERTLTPKLVQLLSATAGFEKVYEAGDEVVFGVR
jgi:hypothetical protein